MTSKSLNALLIIAIVVVLAVVLFFAYRLWTEQRGAALTQLFSAPQEKKKFSPEPIVNKGKESEDRDAALEADVRTIDAAVRAWATDHKGKYPESDFRNPCAGVRMCLKGVNINTPKKIYLERIPQAFPYHQDYYYRADNAKKTYCVKMPSMLETAAPLIFQCTQGGCAREPFVSSCW
ncbi:hypothetical protein HY250_03065 [Candidatus Azambacteria bacterium]|nr:hypothetical protein [Candidatus Azambacteria bacterium]MBI3685360.1 hypothetical protein [Candidatus Azambacteria bacterium]